MKRIYASNNSLLDSVTAELGKKYDIIASDDYEDMFACPYVILLKSNGHNVYRVLFGGSKNRLIVQEIAYAFDVNGKECYDEAHDYADEYNLDESEYANVISYYIDKSDIDDPEYTQYEEDTSEDSNEELAAASQDKATRVLQFHLDKMHPSVYEIKDRWDTDDGTYFLIDEYGSTYVLHYTTSGKLVNGLGQDVHPNYD